MTVIEWGKVENRRFESGIDHGVLYPIVGEGVPWDGLVSIEEATSGGEATPYYFDGIKYLDAVSNEDFQATLSAVSAPVEFNSCDGIRALAQGLFATQQQRTTFGLSWRTRIGGATNPKVGYKLHLVYTATASASPRKYSTQSDKVEPELRTWTIDTVPPQDGLAIRPTAHFIIDSTKSDPAALAIVENHLYGWHQDPDPEVITVGDLSPYLPTPSEINSMMVVSG